MAIISLLGFEIELTNLQTNDLLLFNGQKWINHTPNTIPTELAYTPSGYVTDGTDVILNGIPIRNAPDSLKRGVNAITLTSQKLPYGPNVSNIVLDLIPIPFNRVPTMHPSETAIATTCRQESHTVSVPQLEYDIV